MPPRTTIAGMLGGLTSRRLLVGALIAVLSLAGFLTLARTLDRLGVFARNNILFDADPSTRLLTFAEGFHLGIAHPTLMAYFTPPIRGAAKLIVAISSSDRPESAVRRTLAIWIVPVASAMTTALVFTLVGHLGFSFLQSITVLLLSVVSFSRLVFGSIPESYGLTALAIAVGYVLAASGRDPRRGWVLIGWVCTGVFATGVTITNIVFVTMLMLAAAWKVVPRMAALIHVVGIAVAIFGLTGISAWMLDDVVTKYPVAVSASAPPQLPPIERSVDRVTTQFNRFAVLDPARPLLHFPTTIANTFAPPPPALLPDGFGFTLKDSPSILGAHDPFGFALVVLIVAGTLCWFMNNDHREIAAASLGIIAFSVSLSIWGNETFLYSQHWHLATVVLMAGVMRAGPASRTMTAVMGVVTLIIGVKNFALVRDLLDSLAGSA